MSSQEWSNPQRHGNEELPRNPPPGRGTKKLREKLHMPTGHRKEEAKIKRWESRKVGTKGEKQAKKKNKRCHKHPWKERRARHEPNVGSRRNTISVADCLRKR